MLDGSQQTVRQYVKPPRRRWPRVLGAIVAVIIVLVLAAAIIAIVRPAPVMSFLESVGISVPQVLSQSPSGGTTRSGSKSGEGSMAGSSGSETAQGGSASGGVSDAGASGGFSNLGDKAITETEAAEQAEQQLRTQVTPLIARCDGVDIRSTVPMADLMGILFHQASYDYALPLETELPEAHYETLADTRTFGINRDQVTTEGAWAETEALHLWRTSDATAPDTSIDIGALPGTTVKSPVDGTVVLVREYLLYEETPDVEVHIEPTGRHDLDCVIIHITDPLVKAGDKVVAGKTDIAALRDIESVLTDVQLGFFTPEGVGGNHAHVQVNDANAPGYRENKLEGAITPA